MLDPLGCWILGVFLDKCSLAGAQLLFDALQKATATVAILGTAIWAYFRFVSGRTLKRRLECSIEGTATLDDSGDPATMSVVVTAGARNVGLTKVGLDRAKTGLRLLTQGAESLRESRPGAGPAAGPTAVRSSEYLAHWELLDTLPVFGAVPRLEPNQPAIDELLLVGIPAGGHRAVRLELWVASTRRPPLFGRKWWNATAVVRVEPRVDNTGQKNQKGEDR